MMGETWYFKKIIRKLTEFFFEVIIEKAPTDIPLPNIYYLKKKVELTNIYGPMYLQLDEYYPYSDSLSEILRKNLTQT